MRRDWAFMVFCWAPVCPRTKALVLTISFPGRFVQLRVRDGTDGIVAYRYYVQATEKSRDESFWRCLSWYMARSAARMRSSPEQASVRTSCEIGRAHV